MNQSLKYPYITKAISTYRNELMGWSILWIMMLHFTFTQFKPAGFVAQYGFAGVEIFMLVSGYGLFFSLDKDSRLSRFYKKRLFRIFPTYYLLGIFGSLFIFHDHLLGYLFRYSTLGFWSNGMYADWFVPSIIVLYLVAPLLRWLFKSRRFIGLSVIAVACLLLAFYFVDKEYLLDRSHFFLLYRIPAFMLGMACAYWYKNGISDKYYYALLLMGLPFFVLLFPHHHEVYNYKYFSLLFLLPFFTLSFLTISRCLTVLNPIIAQIGKASLEIYLIQGVFFSAIIRGFIVIPETWHDAISVALIVVSSLLGITAHWVIDKMGINRLF